MGILTDDMTRLSGEIGTMRRARKALVKELERTTRDRRAAVFEMQTDFSNAHARMAKRSRADRMGFASNLKRAVAGQRRAFRADLAGAHQAWFGLTAAQPRAKEFEKRGPAEAKAKARAKPEQQRRKKRKIPG